MTEEIPLISVCVCTYNRSALLNALLCSLASQSHPNFNFEIIVVDNDKKGSAKLIVDQFKEAYSDISIRYEIEPRQGISFARNRTIVLASGHLIAFIDDDEVATDHWLTNLFLCQNKMNADAVFGPVLPVFPISSKDWAIKSQVFERPRSPDCSLVTSGSSRTSNALVLASWCRNRKPTCFAEELAKSGGEDHDFFKWMESQHARLVWSDSASVSEIVPLSRQTFKYVLERRFRASVTYWRGINKTRSKSKAYVEAILGAIGGFAYFTYGILSAPRGIDRSIRYWCKAMNGFGRFGALTSIKPIGYGGVQ